jgi:hypothetical protein
VHVLSQLDGDAVVARGADLRPEGRVEVCGAQLGRALEPATGEQHALGGTHGVLGPVNAYDDAAHSRFIG